MQYLFLFLNFNYLSHCCCCCGTEVKTSSSSNVSYNISNLVPNNELKTKVVSKIKDFIVKYKDESSRQNEDFNEYRDLYNEIPCFFVDTDLDDIDEDSSEERKNIIHWIKSSEKIDLDNITFKDDLRIKYTYRDTKTEYEVKYEGNYKIQKWRKYERYNKVDINDVTHYDNWSYYGTDTSSYKYKSSCLIF